MMTTYPAKEIETVHERKIHLKVAIFIHASLETNEGRARVYNALHAVKEFMDAGDHVDVIFDGAGTRTALEIAQVQHPLYPLFKEIEESITGICRFCAHQFGGVDAVSAGTFALIDDYHQHPSVRNFMVNGYQVLNF